MGLQLAGIGARKGGVQAALDFLATAAAPPARVAA